MAYHGGGRDWDKVPAWMKYGALGLLFVVAASIAVLALTR